MNKFQEIKKTLKEEKPQLQKNFQISKIGIFGSYSTGEQKKNSDLDILVEFSEVPSLFKFIRIENYLNKVLGIKVDLVMKDSLKPFIGAQITKEVVYL